MNQSGSVPTPPPKDDPWRGEKTQVENPGKKKIILI
jgi:hypothetical protein